MAEFQFQQGCESSKSLTGKLTKDYLGGRSLCWEYLATCQAPRRLLQGAKRQVVALGNLIRFIIYEQLIVAMGTAD
jgi:hypothetical protein